MSTKDAVEFLKHLVRPLKLFCDRENIGQQIHLNFLHSGNHALLTSPDIQKYALSMPHIAIKYSKSLKEILSRDVCDENGHLVQSFCAKHVDYGPEHNVNLLTSHT